MVVTGFAAKNAGVCRQCIDTARLIGLSTEEKRMLLHCVLLRRNATVDHLPKG